MDLRKTGWRKTERKKQIHIALDEDTAEFLALSRADGHPDAISAFINSLLRQECFRQGYSLPEGPDISSQPQRTAVEDIMLWRSGLLSPRRKPRHLD